jgi:hypothetical protein
VLDQPRRQIDADDPRPAACEVARNDAFAAARVEEIEAADVAD